MSTKDSSLDDTSYFRFTPRQHAVPPEELQGLLQLCGNVPEANPYFDSITVGWGCWIRLIPANQKDGLWKEIGPPQKRKEPTEPFI